MSIIDIIKNIKPSEILVFMLDNRDIEKNSFIKHSIQINRHYCNRYNFDFVFNDIPKTNRHPSWYKINKSIDLINQNNKYKLWVYIDTDCIFYNHKINLIDYVQHSSYHSDTDKQNADIIFLVDLPYHRAKPCAGFFIFNTKAKSVFEHWNYQDPGIYINEHPWEQEILKHNYTQYKSAMINDWMFRIKKKDQFLVHITGNGRKKPNQKDKYRAKFFENFVNQQMITQDKNATREELFDIVFRDIKQQ
jgi:hypothetical protein